MLLVMWMSFTNNSNCIWSKFKLDSNSTQFKKNLIYDKTKLLFIKIRFEPTIVGLNGDFTHVSITVYHASEKFIVSAVLDFNQGFHATFNYNQLYLLFFEIVFFVEVVLIKNNIFVFCDLEFYYHEHLVRVNVI